METPPEIGRGGWPLHACQGERESTKGGASNHPLKRFHGTKVFDKLRCRESLQRDPNGPVSHRILNDFAKGPAEQSLEASYHRRQASLVFPILLH